MLVPLRINVDTTHRVTSCQIAIGHILSNGDITAFPSGEYPVLIRRIFGQVIEYPVSPPDIPGTSAGNPHRGVPDEIVFHSKLCLNGQILGGHCEGQHRIDPAAALRLVEENPLQKLIARCRCCRQCDRFTRLGLCAHGRYRTPLRHADLNYRDGVFVLRPVGVERMILKLRHDSGFIHLRAADLRGVPAAEVVAVAHRRRQCAVSIAGHNRFALLVFGQRAAVGVEGHGMCSQGLFHGENQRRRYGELIHRCPREGQRIGSGRQIVDGEPEILPIHVTDDAYTIFGNPAVVPCYRTIGTWEIHGGLDGISSYIQDDCFAP